MAYLSDFLPTPHILPDGGGAGGDGGWEHDLTFHVGVGAGGTSADIYRFLNFIAGTVEFIDMGGGVLVERIVPLRHPYLTNMVLVDVNWRFTGRMVAEEPGWTDARVQCRFATPPYNLGGDAPFYTVRTKFGGEFDTLPNGAMAFADGTRITGDWGLFVPEISLIVTTFQSPTPVGPVIAGLVGRVNSVAFLGWAAGFVRFDGVDSDFARTVAGSTTYVKSFAISFRPVEWNKVMRNDGAYEVALNVNTGLPKYQSGDLNALLY